MHGLLFRFQLWAVFFGLCFSPVAVSSADLEVLGNQVILSGEIADGDAERFQQSIEGLPSGTIVRLQSPGGLATEGIAIGRQIREWQFVTYAPYGFCASACGLIWLGGVERWINPNAKVGFHQVYTVDGEREQTSGVGNALVGAYMNELGYSEEAIVFATVMKPDGMAWLSAEWSKIVGIKYQTGTPEPQNQVTTTLLDDQETNGDQEVSRPLTSTSDVVQWTHEGPMDTGNDEVCLVRHSQRVTFLIRKSVDRLEIGFLDLDRSVLNDVNSPFPRVNMRVDDTYNYYSAGSIIDGSANSNTISIVASTIDDHFIDALELGNFLYVTIADDLLSDEYDVKYSLAGSRAALKQLYNCRSELFR